MRVFDQSKADAERAANLNELYNSTKVKKKVESDKRRAEAAEKKYRRTVQKTQQLETKLFDTDMPRILSEFEEMERTRVSTMKSSLEAFSRSYLDFVPLLENCCENINNHVLQIDADGDVNQFILDKKTGKDKETHRTEFEEYNPQFKACVKEGSLPASPFSSATNSPVPQRASSSVLSPASSMSSIQRNSVSNISSISLAKSQDQENLNAAHARHSMHVQPSPSLPSNQFNQANPELLRQQQRASFHQQTHQAPQTYQNPPVVQAPQVAQPSSAPLPPPGISYCRGLHDYNAAQTSELSFKKGDIIKVLEKDASGWWAGELRGEMGFFPSVEWVEEISGVPSIQQSSPVSSPSSSFVQQPQSYQPPQQQIPQQQPPPQAVQPSFRRCKALFPMEPQNPNELALQTGDIIMIEKEADGWYLGTNTRGQRGIFPASFVVLE